MAVFVIAIHTNPISKEYNYYNFYRGTIEPAVPFFFISSGFMLGLKIDLQNIQSIKGKLIAYCKRIFMLYCKWSFLYLPIAIIGYRKENIPIVKAVISYIRNFLFVGEHYNSWHLWYLLSLCYSIALIYFMYYLSLSLNKIAIISFVVYNIATLITYLIMKNINNFFLILYGKVFLSGRIWTGLFFVVTGLFLAKYKLSVSKWVTIPIILIGVSGKGFFYNLSPLAELFTAFGAIGLFLLCVTWKDNSNFNFKIFRKMSTGMYFIHMYVWVFYTYIIIQFPDKYGMDSFIFTALTSVLLSYIKYCIELKAKH